jgi:hypothetical protein
MNKTIHLVYVMRLGINSTTEQLSSTLDLQTIIALQSTINFNSEGNDVLFL